MLSENINSQNLSEDLFQQVEATLTHSNDLDDNYFDSLLLVYPNSEYLIGMKAYFCCLNDNIEEAKQFIETEISQKNDLFLNTYICLAMAMISAYEGDRLLSMRYFEKSLEFDTNRKNKWTRLEYFYALRDSNVNAAERSLEEALLIDPNFTTAFIESINLLIADNRYHDAISKIKAYTSFNTNEKMCYIIGFCHLQMQEYKDAEDWFNESLIIERNVDALVGMGYLSQYISNQEILALNYFNEAYSIEPENATVNKRLGVYYINKDEYQLAKGYLEKSVILLPNQEDFLLLIYAHVVLEEYEDALRLNSTATDEFGWIRDNEFWVILIASLQGDLDKAQGLLDDYYQEYSEEDISWLKRELAAWGVDIVQRK